MSRCIPIFLLMYIYFYIYDMANKQTKMSIMIWHTKKSEQPTKGRMLRSVLCLFYIFKCQSRSSEDYVYIFITIKMLHKVSCYESRGHIIRFIEEQLASCLDLRHGPRICQKFIYVIAAQSSKIICHGTTIHAQDFIQSQGETQSPCRDTIAQVAWTLILCQARIKEQGEVNIPAM